MSAPGSTKLSTFSTLARIAVPFSWPWGGRRIAMSREEPKFCTETSRKPASESWRRTASVLAVCGKVASIVTPPVKSIARLSPRVDRDTIEPIMRMIDSPYHTFRVAMNRKLVGL